MYNAHYIKKLYTLIFRFQNSLKFVQKENFYFTCILVLRRWTPKFVCGTSKSGLNLGNANFNWLLLFSSIPIDWPQKMLPLPLLRPQHEHKTWKNRPYERWRLETINFTRMCHAHSNGHKTRKTVAPKASMQDEESYLKWIGPVNTYRLT